LLPVFVRNNDVALSWPILSYSLPEFIPEVHVLSVRQ